LTLDLRCDVAVVGGGLVGTATAMALCGRGGSGLSVAVLEAEDRLAVHQSGHNSGVIHSGLYYRPDSLKAELCIAGRRSLVRFCVQEEIPFVRCGKLVVATRPSELGRLDELERRGRENGLSGLQRLVGEEIAEVEPHAAGIAALRVPETGIVDYRAVAQAYGRRVEERGGRIVTGARVVAVRADGAGLAVETTQGAAGCRLLVNCAGLESDRVARLCGAAVDVRIVPFRGEYYELAAERRGLVKGLIYPVPDPRFPFLGVHLTRRIGGEVEAGPNAVLAWKRTGYARGSFARADAAEIVSWPGFWRLAARYLTIGAYEALRSHSKRLFLRDLQRLVPELRAEDLEPGGSGIRAQALDRKGALVDDFRIVGSERAIHLLNAPSPGATASIAIGEKIGALAMEALA
jgi:L-2-hydroxyglutarate oxidase